MHATLCKYLALYKTLNIPGIGNFTVETTPATLQFTEKKLQPPTSRVGFAQVVHPTNNHFYSFLSKEWKVEKVIAIRQYKEGVETIIDSLKQPGSSYELKGLGTLQKTSTGEFSFTPASAGAAAFAPLPAERVLRRHAQHTVLVGEQEHLKNHIVPDDETEVAVAEKQKDKWWIYALVLGVLALLMIAYYYIAYKSN